MKTGTSGMLNRLSRLFTAKGFKIPLPWKKTVEIVILYTTDVHGALYPYDYIRHQESHWGLARIATIIQQYRKQYPNIILLDNGDFLQGSPFTYYFNFVETNGTYPVALAMNMLHYDAASVGNHDVEQGPEVYNRVRQQLRFPWLAANARISGRRTYFQPYTIRDFGTLRVGILGMTTPAIPLWLNPELYPGIHWRDMVEEAEHWVHYLKEVKKVDVLVGLFHAGVHPTHYRENLGIDLPEENPCFTIARRFPQLDVILTAHEHRTFNTHPEPENHTLEQPLLLMAGSHGRHLGVVFLTCQKTSSGWKVVRKWAKLERTRQVAAHPRMIRLLQPYHWKVMRYINQVIGYAQEDFSSRYSRIMDTGFLNLIHQVQFFFTKAEISLAASFTTSFVLRQGPIRIRDIYGLYRYENYLYVVVLTGHQIKQHLEWCAQYYRQVNPMPPLQEPLINTNFFGFNFDVAKGIDYEIDISQPVGQRIRNIRVTGEDKPLDPNRTFRVAVNSYRAQQLIQQYHCPVLWKSNKEIRHLIVEYIATQKEIRNQVTHNWRILPQWVVAHVVHQANSKQN